MARLELLHKPEIINKAGRALAAAGLQGEVPSEAVLNIIGNWRAAHSFPLNTMKLWLLKKARIYDQHALVAQRLKRISSIASKLNARPTMKLTQMQDVAGCRAIVGTVWEVYAIARAYRSSDLRHEWIHVDDYIGHPKESGYRGVHLVYRYRSDKQTTSNNLKVEIQLRSVLQHAWATAVETVGIFTHQALKSSQGQQEWLRFFSLMGSALARREFTPEVPKTPDDPRILREELRELCHGLDVEKRLAMFAKALNAPEEISVKNAHTFLLSLDTTRMVITVTGFKKDQLERADEAYLASEREAIAKGGRIDSVLVSVDTFAMLKKAYPNYFLDTQRFIQAVNEEIAPASRRDNPAQRLLPFPILPLSGAPRGRNKVRSFRTGKYL